MSGPALAAAGVRVLLADLDNTLVPYGVPLPTQALRDWNRSLAAAGVTLFVLSNNRHTQRPCVFCESLGVPYLGHAGKPKTGGFYKALEQMEVKPAQAAVVGDQIFTDILGGNRAGIATILVRPIRLAGNPGRYLRYWAEWPFRALSNRRRGG
ncbi:MAG: YqeG family HAD IIIA-type phosphatase [Oscillospiraceae bacterium]|nr:YqeG family HAD IIIA-type phosphatase [Oscillospiraceae bacterium]